jgi:hypothetical protein
VFAFPITEWDALRDLTHATSCGVPGCPLDHP